MENITHNSIKFYKIKDHPNYYVSRCGKVYSIYSKRLLTMTKTPKGYLSVGLSKNKHNHKKFIHRLVILNFINIILDKPQVNHINGIKTDNRIENLEWTTNGENQLHRYRVLGHKSVWKNKKGINSPTHKSVKQLDLNNNLIKVWDCIMDATRELNICNSNIYKCCNGLRKTTGGFKWEYNPIKNN